METGLQVLGGRAGDDLGNFLSGMETVPRIGRLLRPFMRLGNFLSGMETNNHERWRTDRFSLGNFLSGMETPMAPR